MIMSKTQMERIDEMLANWKLLHTQPHPKEIRIHLATILEIDVIQREPAIPHLFSVPVIADSAVPIGEFKIVNFSRLKIDL
jgi:hypothetical protein